MCSDDSIYRYVVKRPHTLSKLYNTVSSTIVTFHIRCSDLMHHIAESFVPFYQVLPISPDNHFSTVCFYDFYLFFKHSTYKWYHKVFVFLCIWLISHSIMPTGFIHIAANIRISILWLYNILYTIFSFLTY